MEEKAIAAGRIREAWPALLAYLPSCMQVFRAEAQRVLFLDLIVSLEFQGSWMRPPDPIDRSPKDLG